VAYSGTRFPALLLGDGTHNKVNAKQPARLLWACHVHAAAVVVMLERDRTVGFRCLVEFRAFLVCWGGWFPA
jgi:hypothetical protein